MSELESYKVETVLRGYHVYVVVWKAAVGQILLCQREGGNIHDPYTVAIVEQGDIVGHVPRAISAVCYMYLFLRRNGTLRYLVYWTAQQRYALLSNRRVVFLYIHGT